MSLTSVFHNENLISMYYVESQNKGSTQIWS